MAENSNSQIKSQIFIKFLNGKTLTLNFPSPSISISTLKHQLYARTKIPIHLQRLVCGPRQLGEDSVIANSGCTVALLLPLRGGKGGFGSLLRGSATKAGQKKTNNFDACRDMSGRRLRHVNAEKRIEEWRNEEEERKLEKVAEEWLKKMAKGKGKKEGGLRDREAEKYVEKYREVSAKCMAEVEESVKEAVKAGLGKRKVVAGAVGDSESKKLKIWLGKRKLGEDDSDSSDDDDEENEKSIVLNNGNTSDSSMEADRSSGSVAGGKPEGDFSGSSSEEEKETLVQEKVNLGESSGEETVQEEENVTKRPVASGDDNSNNANSTHIEAAAVFATEDIQMVNESKEPESGKLEDMDQQSSVVSLANGEVKETIPSEAVANGSSDSKSIVPEEAVNAGASGSEMEKPLNFDKYNTAAELEVLGMERLKSELQTRGLKCGGTLQERAARLFLLKSTPLDKLPKKLLAKK